MYGKSILGGIGERIACMYLKERDYKIIERNFRRQYGEIDIVAQYKDSRIIIVEVKTMIARHNGLVPEDQLTRAKLKTLQRIGSLYAGENDDFPKRNRGWQIDLVAISIHNYPSLIREFETTHNLTNMQKHCDIRHYENL